MLGLAGLFIRKPGDGKKLESAEKKADDMWNDGYKHGLAADRGVTVKSTSVPTVA